jgi:hypothetical protein
MRRDLGILAAAFLLSLPLVTPRVYASDEVQYVSYLRSLWFDRDVSFENEYQHYYDAGVVRYPGFHETFLERTTETGRRISFATIGPAILWSPFYAVADAAVALGIAGGGVRDGYGPPYIRAIAYGSAFYGWLAVVLGWAMARRLGLGRGALAGALAVWLGTPLLFYMYVAPPMSHAASAFAVAAVLLVWLRARERWSVRGGLALGALAALMAMVREQDAFIALAPAVDWALAWWQSPHDSMGPPRRRLAAHAAAGVAAFALCYLPQLLAYQALNGYFGPSRLVARKMNWLAPHAGGVLASVEHGLFFWTPLAVLAIAGLVAGVMGRLGWTARPTLAPRGPGSDTALVAALLLVVVALQVYVAGSVESWTVAGAFGQRRFVSLTAAFLVGLAALWPPGKDRWRGARDGWGQRALVGTLFALGIWWNMGLMVQFGSGLMDRQRLTLAANAYHTFVTVPQQLPRTLYRYVFERHTFFQRPAP